MNNKVELIGTYGGDISHSCSAWTSTNRELTEDKRNRISSMLHTLAEKGHETPFEKSALHFLVTTDIASHIHLLKHRISSLNAESARYKEIKEDKYYLPDDWGNSFSGCQAIESSQDLYYDEECIATIGNRWLDLLDEYSQKTNILYHACVKDLTEKLGRKRAKESARFFKMYNSQITADVMFNFRSFVNLQRLRNDENAQIEIRDITKEMLRLVKNTGQFNESIKAFGLWDKA